MSKATKTRVKDKFEEFIADHERRRLYERESLAFDASEMISLLMEEKGVSKAQLARRAGKTRADITQLLSGARNMTMHTLADLAFALGSRVELEARDCPLAKVKPMTRRRGPTICIGLPTALPKTRTQRVKS